eukprot:TRINITY_DN555_c2_g1_i2.p1 TRINITY_DN555_c2_g1~~TRINITY_DN555_c2_g1_i2.p1  ORF type:complete len:886 (+),score=110.46 TRINITY_DN555_c2_g1_i2:32-2659(+)
MATPFGGARFQPWDDSHLGCRGHPLPHANTPAVLPTAPLASTLGYGGAAGLPLGIRTRSPVSSASAVSTVGAQPPAACVRPPASGSQSLLGLRLLAAPAPCQRAASPIAVQRAGRSLSPSSFGMRSDSAAIYRSGGGCSGAWAPSSVVGAGRSVTNSASSASPWRAGPTHGLAQASRLQPCATGCSSGSLKAADPRHCSPMRYGSPSRSWSPPAPQAPGIARIAVERPQYGTPARCRSPATRSWSPVRTCDHRHPSLNPSGAHKSSDLLLSEPVRGSNHLRVSSPSPFSSWRVALPNGNHGSTSYSSGAANFSSTCSFGGGGRQPSSASVPVMPQQLHKQLSTAESAMGEIRGMSLAAFMGCGAAERPVGFAASAIAPVAPASLRPGCVVARSRPAAEHMHTHIPFAVACSGSSAASRLDVCSGHLKLLDGCKAGEVAHAATPLSASLSSSCCSLRQDAGNSMSTSDATSQTRTLRGPASAIDEEEVNAWRRVEAGDEDCSSSPVIPCAVDDGAGTTNDESAACGSWEIFQPALPSKHAASELRLQEIDAIRSGSLRSWASDMCPDESPTSLKLVWSPPLGSASPRNRGPAARSAPPLLALPPAASLGCSGLVCSDLGCGSVVPAVSEVGDDVAFSVDRLAAELTRGIMARVRARVVHNAELELNLREGDVSGCGADAQRSQQGVVVVPRVRKEPLHSDVYRSHDSFVGGERNAPRLEWGGEAPPVKQAQPQPRRQPKSELQTQFQPLALHPQPRPALMGKIAQLTAAELSQSESPVELESQERPELLGAIGQLTAAVQDLSLRLARLEASPAGPAAVEIAAPSAAGVAPAAVPQPRPRSRCSRIEGAVNLRLSPCGRYCEESDAAELGGFALAG